MKVYLVVINDRHVDTKVEVHKNELSAVGSAYEHADDYGDATEIGREVTTYDPSKHDGWILLIVCGVEGDHVFVQETEIL